MKVCKYSVLRIILNMVRRSGCIVLRVHPLHPEVFWQLRSFQFALRRQLLFAAGKMGSAW